MHKRQNQTGFTIVELLIVIVVIGVLAGIVFVQYVNAVDRAKMAVLADGITSYIKVLDLYNVYKGSYPVTQGNYRQYVCLGESSDFGTQDGWWQDFCGTLGQTTLQRVWVDSTFNSQLKQYVARVPSVKYDTTILSSNINSRSPQYYGTATGGQIDYVLKGDKTCPIGSKYTINFSVIYTGCHVVVGQGINGDGAIDHTKGLEGVTAW